MSKKRKFTRAALVLGASIAMASAVQAEHHEGGCGACGAKAEASCGAAAGGCCGAEKAGCCAAAESGCCAAEKTGCCAAE